jgi:hypothetical protein
MPQILGCIASARLADEGLEMQLQLSKFGKTENQRPIKAVETLETHGTSKSFSSPDHIHPERPLSPSAGGS